MGVREEESGSEGGSGCEGGWDWGSGCEGVREEEREEECLMQSICGLVSCLAIIFQN